MIHLSVASALTPIIPSTEESNQNILFHILINMLRWSIIQIQHHHNFIAPSFKGEGGVGVLIDRRRYT